MTEQCDDGHLRLRDEKDSKKKNNKTRLVRVRVTRRRYVPVTSYYVTLHRVVHALLHDVAEVRR